jgi:catechol 2,3-dioxygenase-like lactoylglutathione lyase family enzyme
VLLIRDPKAILATSQHLSLTALLADDYDPAIAFYVMKLGFELHEDTRLSAQKRWVVVAPPGSTESGILLAKAANAAQAKAVGNQAGGRVFLFLETDDFARDYEIYRQRDARFTEPPRVESFGAVAVFQDLYGNTWDLIQAAAQ